MTDYNKLVEALRCENTGDDECGSSDCPYWSGLGCMDGQLMEDAADAIEALQAQLPKRGEFEKSLHEMFDSIWDCDINHPIFQDTVGELMEAVLQAYDTVNGAKMEVQDD